MHFPVSVSAYLCLLAPHGASAATTVTHQGLARDQQKPRLLLLKQQLQARLSIIADGD